MEIFDSLNFNEKEATLRNEEVASSILVITDIRQAVRSENRVNVFVNNKFSFSLDVYQITELGIRVGQKINEEELLELEKQSQFGKIYSRAVEYCLMRPHSKKEVYNYLQTKTLDKPAKKRSGELFIKKGIPKDIVLPVINRLEEKGYIDDNKFATYWVNNRNYRKGISVKKIKSELIKKGVSSDIIENAISESSRDDQKEIIKVINKKRSKYNDEQKLINYLMRQGFKYDDIKKAIANPQE